jgi:Cys-rich protein (TIGR01571 family)
VSTSLLVAVYLCSDNLLAFSPPYFCLLYYLKKLSPHDTFCLSSSWPRPFLIYIYIFSWFLDCILAMSSVRSSSSNSFFTAESKDVFTDTCFNYVKFLLCPSFTGLTGLFCPCVLFGRNVESLREDTPWTTPCMCHAICVEGGIALAAATTVFRCVDPSFLICEGLLFAWWMCGIYTGLVRQSLQKKYHLKVISRFLCR